MNIIMVWFIIIITMNVCNVYCNSCERAISNFVERRFRKKCRNWLKIKERTQFKVFSFTYRPKSLKNGQPSYLRSLLSYPSRHSSRFSSLITLSRPSLTSRLKIANRYFYHSASVLWNSQSSIWFTSRCSSCHSFSYIKLTCLWSFNLSFA